MKMRKRLMLLILAAFMLTSAIAADEWHPYEYYLYSSPEEIFQGDVGTGPGLESFDFDFNEGLPVKIGRGSNPVVLVGSESRYIEFKYSSAGVSLAPSLDGTQARFNYADFNIVYEKTENRLKELIVFSRNPEFVSIGDSVVVPFDLNVVGLKRKDNRFYDPTWSIDFQAQLDLLEVDIKQWLKDLNAESPDYNESLQNVYDFNLAQSSEISRRKEYDLNKYVVYFQQPFVLDSKGWREDCTLAYPVGKLTVSCPSEIFSKGVYPLFLDPTVAAFDANVTDPNGGETITLASDQNIDFAVGHPTENEELRVALYYSGSAGDFNVFIADLNLNDHQDYDNLSCPDTNWADNGNCTYDMNWQQEGTWVNDPSLVAYWPLDVDARDFNANGLYDGTITGVADENIGVAGKVNRAMAFDGISDYIVINGSARAGAKPLNLNTDFTITAWIYPRVSQSAFLINNYQAGDGKSILLHIDPAGANVTFEGFIDDGVASPNAVSKAYAVGQWYHVAMVRDDGTNIQLYVNGIVSGAAANDTTTGTITSDKKWTLGARADSTSTEEFIGMLDDVKLFNRVLSADEIRNMYNAHAADGNVNYVDDGDYFIDANVWDTSDQNAMDSSDASFTVALTGAPPENDCTYGGSGDWTIDDGSICIRTGAAQVNVDGDLIMINGQLRLDNSIVCFNATGQSTNIYPTPNIDVNNGGTFKWGGCT